MSTNYDALIKLQVDANKSLDELQAQLQRVANNSEQMLNKSFSNAGKKTKKSTSDGIVDGVKEGTKRASGLSGQFTQQLKNRLTLTLTQGIIDSYRRAFKDIVENVKELDKAQTELKKVSNLSGKSLERFTDQAYEMSSSVAKTGTEIIQASAEFKKMGVPEDQLLTYTKAASVFQNVADSEVSAGDAASFIYSQLKAFNKEGLSAINVVDRINEVSNNFGVSTTDLSQALTKTAGAFATYGNKSNETIALITAGVEVMPRQASKIARGWRTIGANIVKLAESADTFTDSSGKVSVGLKNENGELKSTYQIMKDLSPQWDKLNAEQKSNVALSLAGKSHMEVFSATMNNFTTAIKANATALSSSGSAMEENKRYLDSIEGKLSVLKTTWEQFSYHFLDSDFFKSVIDMVTLLVKGLDNLTKTLGGLPTLFIAVTGSVGLFKGAIKLLDLPSILLQMSGISKAMQSFNTVGTVTATATATKTVAATGTAESIMGTTVATEAVGGVSSLKRYLELSKAQKLLSQQKAEYVAKLGDEAKKTELLNTLETASISLHGKDKAERNAINEARKRATELTGTEIKNMKQAKKAIASVDDEVKDLALIESQMAANETAMASFGAVAKSVLLYGGIVVGVLALTTSLDKLKESMSLDAAIDNFKNLSGQVETTKDEIDSLKEKQKQLKEEGKDLNAEDKRRLQYLNLQLEKLEAQLKIEERNVKLRAYEEYQRTHGKGKGGDTQSEGEREIGLIKARAKAQRDYNDALEAGDKIAKDEAEKEMFRLNEKLAESTEDLTISYNDFVDAMGGEDFDYEKLGESKDWFDEMSRALLASTTNIDIFKSALDLLPDDFQVDFIGVDKNGTVQTITANVEDLKNLTDEELQLLVDAQAQGEWESIQKYVDEYGEGNVPQIFIDINSNFKSVGEDIVKKDKEDIEQPANVGVTFFPETNEVDVARREAQKPMYATVHISAAVKKAKEKITNFLSSLGSGFTVTGGPHFATGKRKGEQGGLSWLGDEGSASSPRPELVVGEHGAYLAGTKGWEMYDVKPSDTVYTYAQTKKLLGGSQKFSTDGEVPRYKKGKSSLTKKKFDTELATLKHKSDVEHWTDAQFQAKYDALYSKYRKVLSTDQKREYEKSLADYRADIAKADIESLTDIIEYVGDTSKALSNIKSALNAKKISSDEAKKLRQEVYEKNIEYTKKEFEAGRKSYADLYKVAQEYWREVGKDSKEYYETLDDLRKASKDNLDKQKERKEDELDYAKQYINLQINSLENQKKVNEAERESVANVRELNDLQNNLTKARNQMVLVWKEGVGWTYEQDLEAIEEAQRALDDYNLEHANDSIDELINKYQTILDLFGDLKDEADFIALGQKLGLSGISDLVGSNILNELFMGDWIKDAYTNINAFDDMIAQLENMSATMYQQYASSGITSAMISEVMKKYMYSPSDIYAHLGYYNGLASSNINPMLYSPMGASGVTNNKNVSQSFNFDNIVLPNVTNGEQFVEELQGIALDAIQNAYQMH